MRKHIIRGLAILFLLPGFLFDLCLGLAFIMNDGRTDRHNGDVLLNWAIHLIPKTEWVAQLGLLSAILSTPFAFVTLIGLILGILLFLVYLLVGFIGILAGIVFEGEIKWYSIFD